MKQLLVLPIALALATAGALAATVAPGPAPRACAALAVDDPPPDPIDCPFCGGDPDLHQRRFQALALLGARLMQSALW
jgi:hypothetical protein